MGNHLGFSQLLELVYKRNLFRVIGSKTYYWLATTSISRSERFFSTMVSKPYGTEVVGVGWCGKLGMEKVWRKRIIAFVQDVSNAIRATPPRSRAVLSVKYK